MELAHHTYGNPRGSSQQHGMDERRYDELTFAHVSVSVFVELGRGQLHRTCNGHRRRPQLHIVNKMTEVWGEERKLTRSVAPTLEGLFILDDVWIDFCVGRLIPLLATTVPKHDGRGYAGLDQREH